MKEKILDFWSKAVAFVKKNLVVCISCLAALIVVITVIAVVAALNREPSSSNDGAWGYGITEDIPEFDGECDSIDESGDDYFVAYYSDVSGNEVTEYIAEIEQKCEIKFKGDKYPRSAVYGDRIIAVHYNVTEKMFSVTVVSKNIENTDIFGASQ